MLEESFGVVGLEPAIAIDEQEADAGRAQPLRGLGADQHRHGGQRAGRDAQRRDDAHRLPVAHRLAGARVQDVAAAAAVGGDEEALVVAAGGERALAQRDAGADLVLAPRMPPLLALNEPETSLHPDLSEPLAHLIARAAEGTQLWITTHSERLASAIAEHTSCRPIRLEKVGGETRVAGQRLVPEDDPIYEHMLEGADDMPAHVRAALTQTHLAIPVAEGNPLLGTWQGIYVFDHRRASQTRRVVLHLMSE